MMNFKFSMINLKYVYCLLAAVFIINGCSDNSTGTKTGKKLRASVYVMNEGNFSQSDGTVTAYNPKTGMAVDSALRYVNGRPFVGLIQNSRIIGKRLYIVYNRPDKIEAVNLKTLKSLGTIKLSEDPTALAPASSGEAYVTNLYGNSVTLINLDEMKETSDTIAVGLQPYFAYKADGKIFVSNYGSGNSNTISVIDIKSGSVEKTLKVGPGPLQIVEDAAGRLWVVCKGKTPYMHPENNVPGGIYIINPKQETVVDSIKTGSYPRQIALDRKDGKAFVIYNGKPVAAISVSTLTIENTHFIDPKSRNFQAIGFSPSEGVLYIGESRGYTQAGAVIRYNLQGAVIDSFKTGISPIEFQFVRK
jgi:YVTN family beta-propeller protein